MVVVYPLASDFVRENDQIWRVGRAVDCGGLENRWALIASRGFESLTLCERGFTTFRLSATKKSRLEIAHLHFGAVADVVIAAD